MATKKILTDLYIDGKVGVGTTTPTFPELATPTFPGTIKVGTKQSVIITVMQE